MEKRGVKLFMFWPHFHSLMHESQDPADKMSQISPRSPDDELGFHELICDPVPNIWKHLESEDVIYLMPPDQCS